MYLHHFIQNGYLEMKKKKVKQILKNNKNLDFKNNNNLVKFLQDIQDLQDFSLKKENFQNQDK